MSDAKIREKELVSIPNGDVSEYIFRDLLAEGFEGQELFVEYAKRKSNVRPAVEKVIQQALDAADGKTEAYSMKDIFGEE